MGIDTARLKERFEKKSGRADRLELHDGDNTVRLLPPSLEYMTDTVDYIAFEYKMHFQLGSEGDRKNEICPKSLDPKSKCPVCEVVSMLYKTEQEDDKALASKIYAKKRFIFNVIDLENKDKGIQILEVGIKIYEAIVQFTVHPKWGDLLDLDVGRDITITKVNRKESKSKFEEYSVAPDPTIASTREYLPDNFKEAIGNLQKSIPQVKTYDELKAILEGGESTVDMAAVKASAPISAPTIDTPAEKAPVEETRAKTPPKAPAPAVQDKVVASEPASGGPRTSPLKMIEKDGQQVPYCFGDLYAPRRAECIPCQFKVDCRTKFLEV